MVINIAIKGGLGNQLFQYSLGKFLGEKYASKVYYDILPLDFELEHLTKRDFLLDHIFNDITFTSNKTHQLFYSQHNNFIIKAYKKILRNINKYQYIAESNIQNLKLQDNCTYYFDGYWQDKKTANYLITEMNSKTGSVLKNNEIAQKIINSAQSVAIHIRRGDYIDNKVASAYHGTCSPEYYKAAMTLIEEKTDIKNYFVFSDDIEWAEKNLYTTKEITFIKGDTNQPIVDLFLMKTCHHQVIANSSFSCWAAYLNTYPQKKVIAPVNWTRKEKTKDLSLYDKTWLLL